MLRHILPIARYTLLEALRNRLLLLALILVAAGLAFTQFLQQIAITESNQIQAALLAALLRVGAVFMLAGYAAVALALALISSLPLALFAPARQVALWGLSLGCELLLVTAFALFCVLSLTQVMSALAAVAGFYLLSRSISALQIMAANPLADALSLGQKVVNFVIDTIAFLLPGLDRMTQTGWLIYAAPTAAEIMQIVAQTAVYMLLLCGAALFDLQRKNF